MTHRVLRSHRSKMSVIYICCQEAKKTDHVPYRLIVTLGHIMYGCT